jgi:hypothetical protein
MNRSQQALPLRWLVKLDLAWCLRLNQASQRRELERLFAAISRLGDGMLWYTLMLALLAVQGQAALPGGSANVGGGRAGAGAVQMSKGSDHPSSSTAPITTVSGSQSHRWTNTAFLPAIPYMR